jgi:hypothetical protein
MPQSNDGTARASTSRGYNGSGRAPGPQPIAPGATAKPSTTLLLIVVRARVASTRNRSPNLSLTYTSMGCAAALATTHV